VEGISRKRGKLSGFSRTQNCEKNPKQIEKCLENEWKNKIIKERKTNKEYQKIDEKSLIEKFENIHPKPFIAKMWHQAKLGTIPTNAFMLNSK